MRDIVVQRDKYLRKITHVRVFGYKTSHQDETWCNDNHTREYIWQLQDDELTDLLKNTRWKGELNILSGSGKRLIINHIGSDDGFLQGAGECFVGKKDSADYHQEMNAVHFERWWSS